MAAQCVVPLGENKPAAAALSVDSLSPALSEETTAASRLCFLPLTFSLGGRFHHSRVNERDAPCTSH